MNVRSEAPGETWSVGAPATVWIAAVLAAMSLGVRWTEQASGYRLNVRVLLALGVAAIVFAGVSWASAPRRSHRCLNLALVLLLGALALRLRSIETSALFIVGMAVVAVVIARRRLAPT